uniref:Protein FAM122A-like n=1 Tax=Heterorhabditis bacteriophora TaxID=37862 RepID=A0A1I7XN35_HETBA
MWALQLIDQEHQEMLESQSGELEEKEDKPPKTIIWKPGSTTSIRWRKEGDAQGSPASVETKVEKPEDERRFTTMMVSTPGECPLPPPPVLGVFISRTISTRRKSSLARSESVLSKSTNNSKFRPFSYSPTNSEMLTPCDCNNKSPWPFTSTDMSVHQNPSFLGPRSAGSAPTLASRGTPSFPLSVITEVNDEDTLHSRRSSRKLPPLKRLESTYETPSPSAMHITHKADMGTLQTVEQLEEPLLLETADCLDEVTTIGDFYPQQNISKTS